MMPRCGQLFFPSVLGQIRCGVFGLGCPDSTFLGGQFVCANFLEGEKEISLVSDSICHPSNASSYTHSSGPPTSLACLCLCFFVLVVAMLGGTIQK